MLIDFQKEKERKNKLRGYWGYLNKKYQIKKEEKIINETNNLISEERKDLLQINRSCRKNVPFLLIFIFFLESLILYMYVDPHLVTHGSILILSLMIFSALVTGGILLFLYVERRNLIKSKKIK